MANAAETSANHSSARRATPAVSPRRRKRAQSRTWQGRVSPRAPRPSPLTLSATTAPYGRSFCWWRWSPRDVRYVSSGRGAAGVCPRASSQRSPGAKAVGAAVGSYASPPELSATRAFLVTHDCSACGAAGMRLRNGHRATAIARASRRCGFRSRKVPPGFRAVTTAHGAHPAP